MQSIKKKEMKVKFGWLLKKTLNKLKNNNLTSQKEVFNNCFVSRRRIFEVKVLKEFAKTLFFNDKKDVFWMGFGMVCCGGRKRARSAARGSAAGERANLNNLYGLIPPPGRRQLFWMCSAVWRWGRRTLFVYWDHLHELSDQFSTQS